MSESLDAQVGEAEALVEAVRPFFAGQSPAVVGAALAQLVALWLAGHQAPGAPSGYIDKMRAEMVDSFVVTTLGLTPLMEAALRR